MDRIPKQEDIFSRYDKKYSVAVGVPEPTVAPSVIDFPKFEQPEPQAKKEQQTSIEVPQPIDVGSMTFNVNDLLQKGLYDAAEYFLGRPLTATERSSGLGERTAQKAAQKDDALLSRVDLLVKASTEQLAILKAAAGPKKEEKYDDDEHDLVRSFDGEEKEQEEEEEDDPFADLDLKKRFIDLYGEDDFDLQSHTDASEWTKDMVQRYRAIEKAAPGQPQGGKAKHDPSVLFPTYDPDKVYMIDDARTILNEWRLENKGLRDMDGSKLFSAYPKLKSAWQTRLKEARAEIIEYRHRKAVLEEADDLLAAPEEAAKVRLPDPTPEPVVGHGLGARRGAKAFKWQPFGRWSIARDQLENDDVLSLRHRDGHTKVSRFPNRTVSAAMKVCLLQALDGKPVTDTLLVEDEKEWLDHLLHDANIKRIKKAPEAVKLRKTPGQIRERISVLMGEIAIGENNNPLLVAELKSLYQQAVMRDLLTEEKQRILKDFLGM